MKNTLDYLKNKLNNNDTIVIACSGGPDSMFLLRILLQLRTSKKLNLICAHGNHNLREQSIEEYNYVKQFCNQNNIEFEYLSIEKYHNDNFHNDSRTIRYNFFEQIVKKYCAKYLMTAHHGDDLIETILMRITRGSNLNGYSGFKLETKLENYSLIRPLIYMTKQEIKDYMDKNNYTYFVDQSNFSDKYTRNRYRKYILPTLKKENKNIHEKYLEFSNELDKCNKYLDKIVKEKLPKIYNDETINIKKLLSEDDYVVEKIIQTILKNIYHDDINLVNNKHVSLIINMLKDKKPNVMLELPNQVFLVKEYNNVKIKSSITKKQDYSFILKNQLLYNNFIIEEVPYSDKTDNYHIYLNSNEIKLPIIVRNKQNGDKMEIKNLNGHKKVKSILIDAKIPVQKRIYYPIVTDSDNNILWIPGIKKSKFDKAKTKNYDIILRYQEIEGEKYE